MGQTGRSGQLPRASRQDTAGHKPLQNSELHKHRHRWKHSYGRQIW